MDKQQLIAELTKRGFPKKVILAFSKVNRSKFIPKDMVDKSYEDTALPIGMGQTISQPSTIAMMFSLLELKKGQKILEIGSGCGYALALLSEIVGEKGKVFGVEIIKELAEISRKNLSNYKNIKIYNASGFKGLKEHAKFNRILISAACREIPKEVLLQLKNNGILVAPLGSRLEQSLVVIKRVGNEFSTIKEIPGFVFVPFVEG